MIGARLNLDLQLLLLALPLVLWAPGNAWAGCPHSNPDPDHDKICNSVDNCQTDYNPGQENTDSDPPGNACDNCPSIYNPSQADGDADGSGDACDAWTMCADIDDGQVRLPDPSYVSFLPPAKGQSYTDAALGCTVTRLTDAVADGLYSEGSGLRHAYSTPIPFNSDASRILVQYFDRDAGKDIKAVIDRRGCVTNPPTQTPDGVGLWSITNPDLLHYLSGLEVWSFNIRTGVKTQIGALPAQYNYTQIVFPEDSDPSFDGSYLLISDGAAGRMKNKVHLFTIATGAWTEPLSGGTFDAIGDPCLTISLNGCDVTPSNKVLCRFDTVLVTPPPLGQNCQGKTASQVLELYDPFSSAPNKLIREVTHWAGHMDTGRDTNGDDIMVIANESAPVLSGCYPGIERVSLTDCSGPQGCVRTCLLSWQTASPPFPPGSGWWGKGIHISLSNVGGHPWVLLSNYSNDSAKTRSFFLPENPACLPSCPSSLGCTNPVSSGADWRCLWGKYYNEVLMVSLDGTQVHRLAHHRARDNSTIPSGDPDAMTDNGFWATPRAALSHDGKFALFDSNYNVRYSTPDPGVHVSNYTDVYLIPTATSSPSPQAPHCGPCLITYCGDVGVRCTFNDTCGLGGCGSGCCNYTCIDDDPTCTAADSTPPSACNQ